MAHKMGLTDDSPCFLQYYCCHVLIVFKPHDSKIRSFSHYPPHRSSPQQKIPWALGSCTACECVVDDEQNGGKSSCRNASLHCASTSSWRSKILALKYPRGVSKAGTSAQCTKTVNEWLVKTSCQANRYQATMLCLHADIARRYH